MEIEYLVMLTVSVIGVLAYTLITLLKMAWTGIRKSKTYRKAYYKVFR